MKKLTKLSPRAQQTTETKLFFKIIKNLWNLKKNELKIETKSKAIKLWTSTSRIEENRILLVKKS